jgi:hypothetical protein
MGQMSGWSFRCGSGGCTVVYESVVRRRAGDIPIHKEGRCAVGGGQHSGKNEQGALTNREMILAIASELK